jgi:glutaminase
VVSTRGDVFEVGDSRVEFTAQSSPGLVYALALSAHDATRVHQRIGVEPSGDASTRSRWTPATGRSTRW